jgi:hypothetical protein
MDGPKRLRFLRWAADGESALLGWDDEGRRGYVATDGSVIPIGDPRLAEYEADRRRRLGESCEETRQALDAVFDTVADLGNGEPFPRDFLLRRPECVLWLMGRSPDYRPTLFELRALRPAYVERLRRLMERGLARAGGRENADGPPAGQTPAGEHDAAPQGDGGRPDTAAGQTAKRGGGATVNARMVEKILRDPEARGWTARRWASFLKCSPGTVGETDAWKELATARALLKADRAKDRRRLGRTSGRRRD